EPVIHLAGVHLRAIVDLRRAVEIVAAVADISIRIWKVAGHGHTLRVETVLPDDVAGERRTPRACRGIAAERIVDDRERAVRVERLREVTAPLAAGRKAQRAPAGGVRAVTFERRPEERAVLDDRTAEAAAAEMEIRIGLRRARQIGEEVVLR